MRSKAAKIAWAAAIFEGEGSISFGGRLIRLHVGMTDEDIVRRFYGIVKVGKIYGPRMTYTGKWRWDWVAWTFKDVKFVVNLFMPWLGKRRKKTAKIKLREYKQRTIHLRGDRRLEKYVKEIRHRAKVGESYCSIARHFEASPNSIRDIALRITYK